MRNCHSWPRMSDEGIQTWYSWKKAPVEALWAGWGGGSGNGKANIRAISTWDSITHALSVVHSLSQLSPDRHFSTSCRLCHDTNLILKECEETMDQNKKELFLSSLESPTVVYRSLMVSKVSFLFLYLFSLHKILRFFQTALVWQNLIACLGWGPWSSHKLIISFCWRPETLNCTREINGLVALWNFKLFKLLSSSSTFSLHLELNLEENQTPDIISMLMM